MYAGGHALHFVEEVVNPHVPYLLGSLGPDRYARLLQLLLGGGSLLLA